MNTFLAVSLVVLGNVFSANSVQYKTCDIGAAPEAVLGAILARVKVADFLNLNPLFKLAHLGLLNTVSPFLLENKITFLPLNVLQVRVYFDGDISDNDNACADNYPPNSVGRYGILTKVTIKSNVLPLVPLVSVPSDALNADLTKPYTNFTTEYGCYKLASLDTGVGAGPRTNIFHQNANNGQYCLHWCGRGVEDNNGHVAFDTTEIRFIEDCPYYGGLNAQAEYDFLKGDATWKH